MKECKDCEFFCGYDYSDGTPKCKYDGGYECCPYNDYANTKNNGMKIEIDVGFMHDYIRHTLQNTIEGSAIAIARTEVERIVSEELKNCVVEEVKEQVHSTVSDAISSFMSQGITIGGGWREPERTLSRTEYLAEVIEKELEKRFKEDALKEYAAKEVKSAIDRYERKLRDEINAGIKTYFNEATRQILTDNVVSLLMQNDTFQRLSNSMNTFLPSGEEK